MLHANLKPDRLQKVAMTIMVVFVFVTFIGTNLQAFLWQSSDWLVSTVLPAVVIDLTNEERSHNAEQPLQRSAVLDAAAKLKAEDMAKNEYFAHFSPTGVSPWHWFDEAGYVYAYAGENLAIHFTDSTEVVDAWMNSPDHRANIVSDKYTEIGVGTAKGTYEGYDTVYVVQLFGTPAVPPIKNDIIAPSEPKSVATELPAPDTTAVLAAELEKARADVPQASTSPAQLQVATEVDFQTENRQQTESEVAVQTPSKPLAEITSGPTPTSAELVAKPKVPDPAIPSDSKSPSDPEVMVIESSMVATSSGLAVANIVTPNNTHAGATAAALATKPNLLLQSIYLVLGVLVLVLLLISMVLEARRFHYTQVAYSALLLLGMGGLWFINSLLTSGAAII